jgi:hypothetical protein
MASGVSADQKRVTVRRLVRNVFRGQPAAGARLVLDHHRLAENLRGLVGHKAGKNIVAAAGGEADHQVDRPGRIIALRACRRDRRAKQQHRQDRPAAEISKLHFTFSIHRDSSLAQFRRHLPAPAAIALARLHQFDQRFVHRLRPLDRR